MAPKKKTATSGAKEPDVAKPKAEKPARVSRVSRTRSTGRGGRGR